MNCPNCNAWLSDSDKTCDYCGAEFSAEPLPADWPAYSERFSLLPPLTTEELSSFAHETILNSFLDKRSYYIRKWRKELEGKKALSGFNWAAFFTGSLWFVWRKYYAFAVLLYVFRLILSPGLRAVLSLAHIPDSFSNLLAGGVGLLITIAIGLCANHFYLLKAVHISRQSRIRFTDNKERISFIHSKGGTNAVALYIAIVLSLAISVAISFLLYRK